MRLRLFAILVTALVTACNDPATFVRAKTAADYPPETKKPTRIQSVSPSCELLGEITEATSMPDVDTTASRHGGTHYIVTDRREVEERVTQGQGMSAGYGTPTSARQRTTLIRAEVYRCKSDYAQPAASADAGGTGEGR